MEKLLKAIATVLSIVALLLLAGESDVTRDLVMSKVAALFLFGGALICAITAKKISETK
jgi:hypothetical protein